MSVINDPRFLLMLIVHLVRSSDVIEKATHRLEPDDFNRSGERGYHMLWSISRDWYTTYRKTIPRTYLELAVDDRISNSFGEFSDTDLDNLKADIEAIYSAPDDTIVPHKMIELLQQFIDDRKVRPIVEALGIADSNDFTRLMDELSIAHRGTRVSTAGNMDDIFTPEGIVFKNTVRTPTNIDFVDEVMGKGTSAGEVYGILGPTGGGKSTLGAMLAAKIAKSHRHVVIFSYETELVPQLSNKIYGYAGKIPRDDLKNICKIEDLSSTYQTQLKESMATCAPYLKAVDMKKDIAKGVGGGGVPELRNKLKEYHDAGHHIDVIIIDQLLSMIDAWISCTSNATFDMRRVYMQTFIEEIRDMVQTNNMNCCCFILHQVNNIVKGASPVRRPRKGDAAEDKSFENNMHFTMQLGTLDKKNRCWLATTKAREDKEKELIVELDPKFWRFNYYEGRFAFKPGTGFYETSAEKHKRYTSTVKDVDRKSSQTMDGFAAGDVI